jgi:uncharacterized protein YlzI (FlbEa/FlbD family)
MTVRHFVPSFRWQRGGLALPGSMNFKRIETVSELPETKLILLNHHFDPPHDELINKIRARSSSMIFAGGRYELLEAR